MSSKKTKLYKHMNLDIYVYGSNQHVLPYGFNSHDFKRVPYGPLYIEKRENTRLCIPFKIYGKYQKEMSLETKSVPRKSKSPVLPEIESDYNLISKYIRHSDLSDEEYIKLVNDIMKKVFPTD